MVGGNRAERIRDGFDQNELYAHMTFSNNKIVI